MNMINNQSSIGARDIDLLFEVGSLRHVDRTWRQFGGVPYANVSEHTLRVAFIGWSLAALEGADAGRVVQMAMIHDLPEVRTGDVNYLTRMYTTRNEDLAIRDQFAGTTVGEEVLELWSEYVAKETLEAHVVKDADTLDCDLELHESAAVGCSLNDALAHTRSGIRERLHTDSARAYFDRLYLTNPHAWHTGGRNRHTSGDWSVIASI
jgi:putative hydrolase of HD superfamily